MTTYGIKARFYTRQAWMFMGKAREAKFHLRGDDNWLVQHQVFLARQAMRCATIYRQIEGRI